MLEKPQYREVLELDKKDFDLASIFRKKEQDAELKKGRKVKDSSKDKKPIWTKIGNIFRKKDKKK